MEQKCKRADFDAQFNQSKGIAEFEFVKWHLPIKRLFHFLSSIFIHWSLNSQVFNIVTFIPIFYFSDFFSDFQRTLLMCLCLYVLIFEQIIIFTCVGNGDFKKSRISVNSELAVLIDQQIFFSVFKNVFLHQNQI